jgi:hypothetical protein
LRSGRHGSFFDGASEAGALAGSLAKITCGAMTLILR